MTNRSAAEINTIMAKHVPELASPYAKYPMKHEKWYGANHKGKKGEPCFLSSSQNAGVKMDYVWGKGPLGPGYYSLLTKAAYVNLYSRVNSEAPGECCCVFSAEARTKIDEWEEIKRIMHARYVAPQPDDAAGLKRALQDAKVTAHAHYQYNQNEQLVIGGVNTLANLR